MTYSEAVELLIGGKHTHIPEDVLVYGNSRRFYIDRRTKQRLDPEAYLVRPLGMTVNKYWLYICPDCGSVHSIHADLIKAGRPIYCGCREGKKSRSRTVVNRNGNKFRIPARKIILIATLDAEESGES